MPSSASSPESAARHRLLFELGRGGMGTVYLALARGPAGFHKLKVVKQLRYELAEDIQFLNMFMDEARLSARLNHPNIVQTNEVGYDGRSYFIEMEYLEGQSFDAVLRRAGRRTEGCPVPIALAILAQCCAGLHYAHELRDHDGTPLQIVHRDVSPHNVFVTYEGATKILDFGIAKAVDSSSDTRTGVVKGKATYMSPEQASRGKVDRRADVFAVGIMLWQAATGARLYGELSDGEIFLKLERGDIPRPRSVAPDVPEALEAIVLRALAHRVEDRYATAEELQIALEEYLSEQRAAVGARQIGVFVSDLFADRREAVRQEIESKVRRDTTDIDASIPRLEQAAGVRATVSGSTHPALARDGVAGGATAAEEPTRSAGRGRARAAEVTRPDAKTPLREPTPTARAVVGEATPQEAPRWTSSRATRLTLGLAVIAGGALVVFHQLRSSPERTSDSRASLASSGKPALAASDAGAPLPAVGAPACTKNAQCAGAQSNTICRQSRCVPLETAECRALAERGQAEDDATVWIGAMFPQKGPNADAFGLASVQTLDLVRRDFAQFAGGLPLSSGKGATRPLGILACDDSSEAQRAAEHLASEIHVPAVIGFRSSQEAIDLATSVFMPNHVLMIVTNNKASSITAVPEPDGSPRLVWRTMSDTRAEAKPIAHLVSDVLEPQVHALKGGSVRVALLRTESTMGVSLADAVASTLRFNDKNVAENGADYREFAYGDAASNSTPERFAKAVRQVTELAPQIILFVGNETAADALILPIEKGWPPGRTKPRYVYEGPIIGDAVMNHTAPDLRKRLFGLSAFSERLANAKYTAHFNEVFATHLSPRGSFAPVYDAGYLAAYAAYAAASPLTGDSLGRALLRLLPPGDRLEVGPTRIFDAFEALRAGRSIDLDGAESSLDFNPETGETPVDFSFLCLGADFDNQESGVVYDRASDTLRGKWSCK